jgi:NNP family nitrate/nitrite transporter-like MFS transporter
MTAVLEDVATTGSGRWIEHWDPDNEEFWARTGKRVAIRNLAFSVLTEHLGFCVWLLWSIAVLNLPKGQFSTSQTLWLTTTPNLVGALVRIPYTFAPARFGGRNWTIVSALLLLIPCGLFVYAINNIASIPFSVLLLIAATTGFGGGNFASSMSNITHFYPARRQGLPLGINAAGGNLGTSVTQLCMPPLIVAFGLVAVGWVWMPLVLLAAAGAYFFMNNLRTATTAYTVSEMVAIAGRLQTWVMSILYIGTFGSFIGYAFSFGVLIKAQFPDVKGADFIWLGAFVGSFARPVGGWLADRFGGAKVTMIDFALMAMGIGAVAYAADSGNWNLFLGAFLFVFATTGIGNGSTYRMIPAIFQAQALLRAEGSDEAAVARAAKTGRRHAAAAIGICSAIGALGGVLIQQAFRISIEQTKGIAPALIGLAVFYGLCMVMTWAFYLRKGNSQESLAAVGV